MELKFIGWIAGGLILLAVLMQLKRQWDAGTAKGVSPWLHLGTAVGNAGFCAHGVLGGDPVIAATSGALVLTSLTGASLWYVHHRRERRGDGPSPKGTPARAEMAAS